MFQSLNRKKSTHRLILGKVIIIALIGLLVLVANTNSEAQIDSRNQTKSKNDPSVRPVKSEKLRPRKRKKKKVKSNRRQVRASKKSFRKKGDVGYSGDITGRKPRTRKTPRKTYARPAPDPYRNRRIRTEGDRAGPPPRRVITATKKGEKARRGDISGQKRIRQKSVSSARSRVYPQPNPYYGRKRKTEKQRGYSNKRERRSIRSQSRPTETRSPKYSVAPVTKSGRARITRKKNVYRNHEQRKGERSTSKDIAGKKLRTRNYRSARPAGSGFNVRPNAALLSKRYGEGQRFKNYRGAAQRSTRRPGDRMTSENLRGKQNQRMRNFRSSRPKAMYQARSVRSTARPRGGEKAVFGKARSQPVRSATGRSKDKSRYRKRPAPISASGIRKIYRQKNTYRGKDRRFAGENSSSRDITGRPLRRRNSRSPRPSFSGIKPYVRGSASRSRPGIYRKPPIRSITGTQARSYRKPPLRTASRTKPGNYRTPPIRSASRKKAGKYGALPIRSSSRAGWNNKNQSLPRKARGAYANASTFKGKHSMAIMPSYSRSEVGQYRGRMKARKPLKGAGGSITVHWNNNGMPLPKRDKGQPVGSYQGRTKAKKPLKGAGGSITVHWNNNGVPLRKKDRGYPVGDFKGKNKSMKARTLARSPGTEYGILKKFAFITLGEEGGYMRTPTPISKDQASKVHPKVKRKEVGQPPGTERGRTKSLSFLRIGNPNAGGLVSNYPQRKKNKSLPSELRKSNQMRHKASPGTELGRTRSLSFLKLGNPSRSGLVSKSSGFGKPKRIPAGEEHKRGKKTTLSFWAYGDPTRGGFYKHPKLAKGRLHPSSQYSKPGRSHNSLEEKDKTLKFKIWWAKLFKKSANQPDAVKEKPKKPRYDKRERDIWETEVREDWYR